MITDAQALTDNADNPEKVRGVLQGAMDYLAIGIDPAAQQLFIQSRIQRFMR